MNRCQLLPQYTEEILSNNLHVIWIEDRSRPAAIFSIQFPSGGLHEKRGYEGIAELASALAPLSGGNGPGSFPYVIEHNGAELSSDLSGEYLRYTVRMRQAAIGEIVPATWRMATSPVFSKNDFRRLRSEMQTSIMTESAEPSVSGQKHFQCELYGDTAAGRHPCRPSLSLIKQADICSWQSVNMVPNGAVAILAADMPLDEMRNSFGPLFASVKSEAATHEKIVLNDNKNGAIRLVDNPTLTQTSLFIGHQAPGETHEDHLPLSFANYILGGGTFQSRLMTVLRSRLGKTYGIGSRISCARAHGAFSIQTTTISESLPEVLDAIFGVYREFHEKGITQKELDEARGFATGHLAFDVENLSAKIDKLQMISFLGRDREWFESLPERFAALTTDGINAAIRRHLSRERFTICAVGKAAQIKPALEKYGNPAVLNFRAPIVPSTGR